MLYYFGENFQHTARGHFITTASHDADFQLAEDFQNVVDSRSGFDSVF